LDEVKWRLRDESEAILEEKETIAVKFTVAKETDRPYFITETANSLTDCLELLNSSPRE
jgi:hypothetical protein